MYYCVLLCIGVLSVAEYTRVLLSVIEPTLYKHTYRLTVVKKVKERNSKRNNENRDANQVEQDCDLDDRRKTTTTMMTTTVTMRTTAAPADAPAMIAMFGVLVSLGRVVVVDEETVGTGSDTDTTPTPNACPHSH